MSAESCAGFHRAEVHVKNLQHPNTKSDHMPRDPSRAYLGILTGIVGGYVCSQGVGDGVNEWQSERMMQVSCVFGQAWSCVGLSRLSCEQPWFAEARPRTSAVQTRTGMDEF